MIRADVDVIDIQCIHGGSISPILADIQTEDACNVLCLRLLPCVLLAGYSASS